MFSFLDMLFNSCHDVNFTGFVDFGKIVYPLPGVRVLSFAVTAINLEDTCCSVFCVFVYVCKRTQNTELCRR